MLLDDEVRVVAYDPAWSSRFEQLAAQLRIALGKNAQRIDHIGSTAVPQLWAKPLIDINVGLAAGGSFDLAVAETVGLTWRAVNPESVLLAAYDGPRRLANIHVRYAGTATERWDLLFRDFLRAHPAIVQQYSQIKLDCARQWGTDRAAYSAAKAPFIRQLTPLMEHWAGETAWRP